MYMHISEYIYIYTHAYFAYIILVTLPPLRRATLSPQAMVLQLGSQVSPEPLGENCEGFTLVSPQKHTKTVV